MRRAHPGQSYSEDQNESTIVSARKRSRTKVACDTCRRRKLGCSGESPCTQCQASNQTCTFSHRLRTTSISSTYDELSERPGQSTPEITSHSREMAVDDTMVLGPQTIPSEALFPSENQWPTAPPQLLTPTLAQKVQHSNPRSWGHDQETAALEPNQSLPPANWLSGHGSLAVGESEIFQNRGLDLADVGQVDSLWHLDDFVSLAKANLSSRSRIFLLMPAPGYRLLA